MLISYVLLLTRQAGGTTTALCFRLYWHQPTLAPLSPFWRCFSICWRASKFDLLLPSCSCCSFSFSLTRTWLLWIKFLQQYDAFFRHITITNCWITRALWSRFCPLLCRFQHVKFFKMWNLYARFGVWVTAFWSDLNAPGSWQVTTFLVYLHFLTLW